MRYNIMGKVVLIQMKVLCEILQWRFKGNLSKIFELPLNDIKNRLSVSAYGRIRWTVQFNTIFISTYILIVFFFCYMKPTQVVVTFISNFMTCFYYYLVAYLAFRRERTSLSTHTPPYTGLLQNYTKSRLVYKKTIKIPLYCNNNNK